MKIKTMTATFGKLQKQTLELKDGLNIIQASNESGKSTWCAFLRSMLYGIDTKARDKKGVIAEKNLYQPWDGGTMEGTITLTHGGRDITLRRTSKGASPLSQFQAVYTGTEEPVPGLSADSVGEVLTGVGRDAFERSAFVGQNAVAVTGSAELERRISAIVSSGQEDVSYSETEKRLREWKNHRYSNQKNGLIPKLQEEQASLTALLGRLDAAHRQESSALAAIRELQAEQTELNVQASVHRAATSAEAYARYRAAKADVDKAQAELDRLFSEKDCRGTPPSETTLRAMQGDLSYLNTLDTKVKHARDEIANTPPIPECIDHPVFKGMPPAQARERASADAATLSKTQRAVLPILSCSLACIVLVLIQLFAAGFPLLRILLSALCVLFVAAVLIWFTSALSRQAREKSTLVALYGTKDGDLVHKQAEEYAALYEANQQQHTDAALRAANLERLEQERQELAAHLLSQTHSFAPDVADLYGVSSALSLALNRGKAEHDAILRLEGAQKVLQAVSAQGIPEPAEAPAQIPERCAGEITARLQSVQSELTIQNKALAMAQGEIHTLGDRAALQARLDEVNDALSRRREEYEAIQLAMEVLAEANTRLQERMSPALNKRAGEFFHRLTGGVYDQVSLTREFEALAAKADDVTPRRLLTLSKGTADQLYLAVRLAVCDLVLPGENPAPLVLDDALVNFDEQRLALALDLLQDLAQTRQILLFTCQNRERLYLEHNSAVHVTGLHS